VLDCSTDDVRLVRQGALDVAAITSALAGISSLTR
jgi:hypothetical protein